MSPIVATLLIGAYLAGLAYLTATGDLERMFRSLTNAIRPRVKPREITLEDIAAIGPYNVPEHQIVAWTPVEREALGVNATDRWIQEVSMVLTGIERSHARELVALEWEKASPEPVGDEIEIYAWGRRTPIARYSEVMDLAAAKMVATIHDDPGAQAIARTASNYEALRAKQAKLLSSAIRGSAFSESYPGGRRDLEQATEGSVFSNLGYRMRDLEADQRKFEESPTVTGGRVFG